MFKQKPEEWQEFATNHERELDVHKLVLEKSSIFFTTSFYLNLPEDLKIYIYPFVTFQKKTFSYFTRYIEMFKVVGNYIYTPELNKKNAKFFIKDTPPDKSN